MLRGLRAATSQAFMDLARGQRWPAGAAGGEVRAARHMRVLDKPTLGEYTTAVVLDHATLPALPGPITSDTQARALPPRTSLLQWRRAAAHQRRVDAAKEGARSNVQTPAAAGHARRGAALMRRARQACGAQAGAAAGAGGGGGYSNLRTP